MKKNIFNIICFSILVFACTSEESKNIVAVFDINLDTLQDSESVSIKKNKYIPLETNNECLIQDVSKIIYKDSLFYLFDRTGNSVFTFNEKGIMKQKIHAIGSGPGEYIDLYDMDIDKEGNIWLYDLPTARLIKYSNSTLEPLENIKIEQRGMFMAVSDSGYIYLGDIYHQGKMNAWLGRYHITDGKFENILENKNNLDLATWCSNYFFRSTENLYYYKRYEPYIYRIEASQVIPYMNLISKRYPTNKLLEECQQDGDDRKIYWEKYIGEVLDFYETDKYMFINIMMYDPIYLVINKDNNLVYKMKFHTKMDFNGKMKVIGSTNEFFIGYYEPTEETLEYILSQEEYVENKDKISELTEESNPILVLFTFDIK